jgi:hypothetical protein
VLVIGTHQIINETIKNATFLSTTNLLGTRLQDPLSCKVNKGWNNGKYNIHEFVLYVYTHEFISSVFSIIESIKYSMLKHNFCNILVFMSSNGTIL